MSSYPPRISICLDCRQSYTRTAPSMVRCPACRLKRQEQEHSFTPHQGFCIDCGQPFWVSSPSKIRCKPCHNEHRHLHDYRHHVERIEAGEMDAHKCYLCPKRARCQEIVKTQAPLPCWAEYALFTRSERIKLAKVPASYLVRIEE